MDKIVINGGNLLNGTVKISGAKNAALPELCAALLTADEVVVTNVPQLRDINTMLVLLASMGVAHAVDGDRVTLNAAKLDVRATAGYELVKTMRASILTLGSLLARNGFAKVSLPGGCAIGARPVEQHIKGLQLMGAQIEVEEGYINAHLPQGQNRLRGTAIRTDMITVTGTANLMMAATLAEGTTVLENAAQEPEIVDLAKMLILMGAKISGHGSSKIIIEGVPKLHGCRFSVVGDRIEAGTFLCAVAATGGKVKLQYVEGEHLGAVLEKLQASGAVVTLGKQEIELSSPGAKALTAQSFITSEYPGFPTDMQAQFMALNCVAQGSSMVTETIFENRFMHVSELSRLGAKILIDGRNAMIEGGHQLTGANVMATDLRASACLIIAGLVAQGTTTIERVYHLDRGYEKLEDKLTALGAQIKRVKA